jgi:hypothetical protein
VAKGLEHGLDSSTHTFCNSSEGADDKILVSDWIEYWDQHGHQLVLDSWIEKYKEFIDPTYQETHKDEICSSEKKEISQSTDHQWTQLWAEHQQEQYLYYQNWFSQWWIEKEFQNQACVIANEDIEVNKLSKNINPVSTFEFENLSLEANPEMEDSLNSSSIHTNGNQSEKTILEKTQDFLVGLGLASNLKNTDSNITNCKVLAMNKKKKMKKKKVC